MKYVRLYLPLILIALFAGLIGRANQLGLTGSLWTTILGLNVLLAAAIGYYYTHPFHTNKSFWSMYVIGCLIVMVSLNVFLWLGATKGTGAFSSMNVSFVAASVGFGLMTLSGFQAVRKRQRYKWSAVLSLVGHLGLMLLFVWGAAKEFMPLTPGINVSGAVMTLATLGCIFICVATHYVERTLLLVYPLPDEMQNLLEQIGEDEPAQSM